MAFYFVIFLCSGLLGQFLAKEKHTINISAKACREYSEFQGLARKRENKYVGVFRFVLARETCTVCKLGIVEKNLGC